MSSGVSSVSAAPAARTAPAASQSAAPSLHTVGGKHDITRIHLTGVYLLPPGRVAIPDWRQRIEFYLSRVAKFHERELTGQSRIVWEIRPTPYVPTAPQTRPKDANEFFWRIAGEVREKAWKRAPNKGFPIVLVFSDTNFCPGYDEWSRACDAAKCICEPHGPGCNGHVTREGEERPGTCCGGARAVYWPEQNMGFGLLTADGWRVPLKGSDCVVYHEGVGHAIGLPHPDPIDNSVMGLAQYVTSLNVTSIKTAQKESLGWKRTPPADGAPVEKTSVFSAFNTDYTPRVPTVRDRVIINATFSVDNVPRGVTAQYQTAFGAWTALPEPRRIESSAAPGQPRMLRLEWRLPLFNKPMFVSYRIIADTGPREQEQQWNLFRVHLNAPAKEQAKEPANEPEKNTPRKSTGRKNPGEG